MRQLTLLLVVAAMSAVGFGMLYDTLPQFDAGKLAVCSYHYNRKCTAMHNEVLQSEQKRSAAWPGEITRKDERKLEMHAVHATDPKDFPPLGLFQIKFKRNGNKQANFWKIGG